jgi:hypothetical protein
MDNTLVVLLTLVGVAALKLVVLFILGKGSLARLGLAWTGFYRTLGDPAFADKVRPLLTAAAQPKKPAKRSGEPLRLLGLLQRDAKMVDFLMQDIAAASDADIAVFVRDMHAKARDVVKSHLEVVPVLPQAEGEKIEVPAGFDPSAIRLLGNLTGQPPYKGALRHSGWRVKDFKLPAPPEGQDEFVLAPAEVDLP